MTLSHDFSFSMMLETPSAGTFSTATAPCALPTQILHAVPNPTLIRIHFFMRNQGHTLSMHKCLPQSTTCSLIRSSMWQTSEVARRDNHGVQAGEQFLVQASHLSRTCRDQRVLEALRRLSAHEERTCIARQRLERGRYEKERGRGAAEETYHTWDAPACRQQTHLPSWARPTPSACPSLHTRVGL